MRIKFVLICFFDQLFTGTIEPNELRRISPVIILVELCFRTIGVVKCCLRNVAGLVVFVDFYNGVLVRFVDARNFHAARFRISEGFGIAERT